MDNSELEALIVAVLYLVKYLLTDHPVFHGLTRLELSNWTRADFHAFFSEASAWFASKGL